MSDFQHRMQIELPSPSKLFTPGVIVSLALLVIGFALVHYAEAFSMKYLALSAPGILTGKVWQLATYPFVEGWPWNLVFGLWVILFAGSAVERQWGTRGYAALWLVVSVISGVVWVLVSMALGRAYIGGGVSVCCYGLIAVFGIMYKGVRFFAWFFTVEGQHIALILIGVGLVLSIPQPVTVVWVGGALVAYIYVKVRWMASRPRSGGGGKRMGGRGGFVDID